MDITKLSDDKIKALAFDALVIIEQQNKNLQVLNAELQNRSNKIMENETTGTPEIETIQPQTVTSTETVETSAPETPQEAAE